MKFKQLVVSVFFISVVFSIYAQDDDKEISCDSEINNKKALKAYEEGTNRKNKKEERLQFLRKAIELEPDFVKANFAYAEERIKTLAIEQAPFKPTEPYFKKVIEVCPKFHSDPYYYLGFIYYEESKWEDCIKYLKEFQNFKSDDDKKFNKDYEFFLEQSKTMIYWAKFYNEINKNPVPFDPYPVKGICTQYDEYLPMISPDNQMMLFTRKQPHVEKYQTSLTNVEKEDELFCYSKRNSATGEFDKGRRMPYPFNHNSNEGGATISIDNKHLFFTICKDEGGSQMNCDVYFSDNINGEWTEPAKVPGINDSIYWDSQPTLASDGVTLYFCSDRKGGHGGVDIYKTVKNLSTGVWSKPQNIGRPVNTNGDEFTPFLHSDFQSLYFSSNGQPSVGGQDIFLSYMTDDGKWGVPKNLGIPINTTGDDIGFFVSADGHYGYFSSNQPSRVKGRNVGKYDIYSFELYKDARPDEIVFIKGKVEDNSVRGRKIFTVDIKDAVTKRKTDALVDTLTGEYMVMVNVKEKNDLIITIKKEAAAFCSQLISKDAIIEASTKRDEKTTAVNITNTSNTKTNDNTSSGAKKNWELKPIKTEDMKLDTLKIGGAYTLNNIYYNTNSADLDPRSTIVIDEFVEYLKANSTIKIEIHGHTDNIGSEKDNLALSTDRAFTVRDMIVKQGISESRILAFKGFGSTQPIADNSTEEGRSKNRRTEFVIVAK